MKLDFKFNITDLAGKEIPNSSADKILANTLSTLNKGNSIKLYDWALKLWNGKGIEIDDTDTEVLQGIIETSEMLTVLSKAQMIEYIKSKKPKEK